MRFAKGLSFEGELEKFAFLRLGSGFDFLGFLPG